MLIRIDMTLYIKSLGEYDISSFYFLKYFVLDLKELSLIKNLYENIDDSKIYEINIIKNITQVLLNKPKASLSYFVGAPHRREHS